MGSTRYFSNTRDHFPLEALPQKTTSPPVENTRYGQLEGYIHRLLNKTKQLHAPRDSKPPP